MRTPLIIAFMTGLIFTYTLQAIAAIDISSCGSLTMANENYILLQNITPTQSTMMTCLSVEAPGITIDCKGRSIFGNDYYTVTGWDLYSPHTINTTFSNIVIKNCDIRPSANGILLSGNNFVLKNNTVYGGKDYNSANDNYDRYGGGISLYNYGTIENNTIEAGGAYAVYVAGGISIPTIISNNTIIGPIYNSYVSGGGTLSIFNNKLIIGGSGLDSTGSHQYAGVTAITLEGWKSANVFNNTFTGSGNYGVFLKYDSGGSGSHIISNNTFDLQTAIGIYADTGGHRIYNNIIKVANAIGVKFQQSSYFENNTIITEGASGSTSYGIYFNNAGNMQLNNSKIVTAGANHIYIAGTSGYNYTFLNTPFNRSLVEFDAGSTNNLIVKWSLNITALNLSGARLNNMNVIAKPQLSEDIVTATITDERGMARLMLTDYEQNATNIIDRNPYIITAYDSGSSYLNTSILINLFYSTEQNITMTKTSVSYATFIQPSLIEINSPATIQLNYTYLSNSSPVTGATVNLTIFNTTPSRAALTSGISMTYIPSAGLWQYNYTTPAGTNGTYKYNIKGSVPGLLGSDVDVNGTFDTKDTTAPQISGANMATSCSGYSNYRLAGSPFDVTFSATDNWEVNRTFSLCNLTLSNSTGIISLVNGSTCAFPTSGQAGSAIVRILVNDTMNNTASASLAITVVDSCPVTYTPPSVSSSGGGSGGGGGGGGGGSSVVSAVVSELPEILFETRALSLVQDQPEKLKITLKNPRNESLAVTLDGPPEVSFAKRELTLSAGEARDVFATLSYSSAGDYKPIISAQLGDLKRMYDLSVTVAKKEVNAVEQLLVDAQKAVNSLILLKGKACRDDIDAVNDKALAIETIAGGIRSALLSKGTPSAAKLEELRRELSTLSGFTDKIEECKPSVIKEEESSPTWQPVKTEEQNPILLPALVFALLFGFGLFRFLKG